MCFQQQWPLGLAGQPQLWGAGPSEGVPWIVLAPGMGAWPHVAVEWILCQFCSGLLKGGDNEYCPSRTLCYRKVGVPGSWSRPLEQLSEGGEMVKGAVSAKTCGGHIRQERIS